jgi:ribosomal-protein-alanine N-acetyltransferase
MSETVLNGARVVLRPWYWDDAADLQRLANDIDIARQMRPGFPYPYLRGDAEAWLTSIAFDAPVRHFCIECDDDVVGCIGYTPGSGDRADCVEVGYWMGAPWRGRGLASDALRTLTAHLLSPALGFLRCEARVFEGNPASMRVLEAGGYARVGVIPAEKSDQGGGRDQVAFAFEASATRD